MGSSAYYAGMAEYMLATQKAGGKAQRQSGNSKGDRHRVPTKAILIPPTHIKTMPKPLREECLQNAWNLNAVHVPSSRAASAPPSLQGNGSPNPSAMHMPSQHAPAGKDPLSTLPFQKAVPLFQTGRTCKLPHFYSKSLGAFERGPVPPTLVVVAFVCPQLDDSTGKPAPPTSKAALFVEAFRDDDLVFPEHLVERNSLGEPAMRTKLDIGYSPWAMSLMEGMPQVAPVKVRESLGGGAGGGGPRDGDGDGDGGGGSGDDEDAEHAFLLPLLTLGFAFLHLLYCIVIYIKDDGFEPEFARTGLGLFGLLAISAIRMSCRTGIEGLILGLGASVGVMVWSAERSYVKREMTPAGFVAVFSAMMSSIFTAALYHSV